jgi:curved DNA-binding protein CbpA
MKHSEALEFLGVDRLNDLTAIKAAYWKLTFKYHPDHGGTTEQFCKLKSAYDIASEYCSVGDKWKKEQAKKLPEWEKDFRKLWRQAYQKSLSQEIDAGLHFNTCIDNFRRGFIYPPSDWFLGTIFGKHQLVIEGQPTAASKAAESGEDARTYYRNHLLRIAPNKPMAESYAKRYWELEFEAKWVFYLPASIEILRGAK